jgi:hypothetical protein
LPGDPPGTAAAAAPDHNRALGNRHAGDHLPDSNDSLTLRDYFISSHAIEQIAFADGTLWLPEDVLNYIEHNIPLPVMDTAESTADIALLKQEICQFLASGDVDDADDAGVAIPLATAQTTAENWRTAIGY